MAVKGYAHEVRGIYWLCVVVPVQLCLLVCVVRGLGMFLLCIVSSYEP